MKILITGATGLIGKELGKALVNKNHSVCVISRDAEKAREQLPFPCQVIEADLVKGPLKKNEDLNSIDVVINLMGESVGDSRWTEARKRKIYESRILGTRHLIESLRPSTKVFINASAVGYYGSCGDEILNEDHASGDDFLAQVCQDWEEELLSLSYGDNSMRVMTLRTGLVLSSQGGAMDPLIALFRRGFGSVLSDGRQWMSWIHIEDAVGMILHALEVPSLRGPMNLVSPEAVTNEQFSHRLAHALQVRLAPRVPKMVLVAALGERANLLLASQRAHPAKALQMGYQYKFASLVEALKNICAPYKDGRDFYMREQYLPLKPAEVFPFFGEAKNLQKITPPLLDFHIVEAPQSGLGVGSKITYRLKIHGVPVRWKTLIVDWDPPRKFVDTQEKGPYKEWHHTHEFIPMGAGTLMRDSVRYCLPLGILGEWAAGILVRKDIDTIFSFRRKYLYRHLR